MPKTIAITGANGFLGKAFVKALVEKNYYVKALVRKMPIDKFEGVSYHLYRLEDDLNKTLFEDVDICIHLAFQFEKQERNGIDVNIFAVENLKKLNLTQYVFVSSFAAASPVTDSYYGKSKLAVEVFFKDELIIRPALVLGNGGIFGRLQTQLTKTKFVPLLNGGKQIIQTILLEDLVESGIFLIENQAKGIYHLAHSEKVFYKNFILKIAQKLQKDIFFIPIPVLIMKIIVAFFQLFSKPPINKDNLTGLLTSKYIDTTSEQNMMPQKWHSFEESLERIKM
ncbi:NAD-dependent epimerase/dehydratase family protein [Lacihabitans sp. CS3-21]|uniref:NAD-dependent epimerase/dehydratase family protein n=1 Tax=Lacihabitans sp. CS3-21 TaxID=2487332 RepID=UPI0020CEBDD4|nr:NAD-dependent epimerase/dehydratase family protein [Lacihabitans sp. CS3-21]MCP9748227.1 NAD-dependent epimerase/dehydratase family protein [Lacihabitans sp. CS3-21]